MPGIVVVVGGANLDAKARSTRAVLAGTSNPGRTVLAPGGVGRNVAEGLARLGTETHLVAAVGDDAMGDLVLGATAASGVRVGLVRQGPLPTGTYTAVLGPDGELVVAVADMAATDALAPSDVDAAVDLIAAADLLVLDGNLAVATLAHALDVAAAAGVRVLLDPVSVPKAAALRPVLRPDRPVFLLTPNSDELAVLPALGDLQALGVQHVWVRRGAAGSLLVSADGVVELAAVPLGPADVVDVTGAGDAMLATFAHALLAGHTPAEAAALGHAAAALTVTSEHTVRPDLTLELVRSTLP